MEGGNLFFKVGNFGLVFGSFPDVLLEFFMVVGQLGGQRFGFIGETLQEFRLDIGDELLIGCFDGRDQFKPSCGVCGGRV